MTKKQREQVVELLRITVDASDDVLGLGRSQGYSRAVVKMACDARWDVSDEARWPGIDPGDISDDEQHTHRLEAAARVEEGSWP